MPTLGRGKLYFAKFTPGTKVHTGFRYIGNTPEFNLNSESETLDHFNSDEGVRVKDDSVLLQLNRAGSFITDNIDVENMSLFLLGETSVLAQASATSQQYDIANVQKGNTYQIGESTSNPTGYRSLTSVTVQNDASTPVEYVAGTDYTIDLTLGLLTILSSGAIANGTNIEVLHSRSAVSRSRIITAASATIEGALKFIAVNPKGENRDFTMPYVQLAPNGDFALKGDEWQQLPFNVEILKLDGLESIYVDGRPYTV